MRGSVYFESLKGQSEKLSQLKRWEDWKRENRLFGQTIEFCHLDEFAKEMLTQYSVQYVRNLVQAAKMEESMAVPCMLTQNIHFPSAYQGLLDGLSRSTGGKPPPEAAVPPSLAKIKQLPTKEHQMMCFLVGLGNRVAATSTIEFYQLLPDGASMAAASAAVFQVRGSDKYAPPREVYYVCMCNADKSDSSLCCLHSLGFPDLPLQQDVVESALSLAECGYHGPRRAHIISIDNIFLSEKWMDWDLISINKQLGWVVGSDMWSSYARSKPRYQLFETFLVRMALWYRGFGADTMNKKIKLSSKLFREQPAGV